MLSLCIKKPVISAVIALVILLLGIICFLTLPLRSFPVIPANKVTVTTEYYGASPDVMQAFVTQPIQEELTGLDGIDYIESTNTQGTSTINIYFNLGFDIDSLMPQITNRVNSVKWKIPKAANSSVIKKINPNSGISGVVIWYGFYSDKMSMEEISAYVKDVITPRIEDLPGVYSAVPFGDLDYQMTILLDPHKMASFGVTAEEVKDALNNANVDSTAGKIKGKYVSFNVNINSNLSKPSMYDDIIVKKHDNSYIKIKDIGKSVLKHFNPSVIATLNGVRSEFIGVVAEEDANAIQISKETRGLLDKMKVNYPPSFKHKVLLDQSVFSKMEIAEVRLTMLVALLFVFLIIFVFLGSLTALIIPVVTVPLSLLGGAFIMLCLGYTMNSLTMLSWVLAIGLVVDDAIVVIENIYRHLDSKLSIVDASIKGLLEIAPAIVAMTLVVAVNFLPVGFVPGYTGALFKEFAFTMSIVVIWSGIIALFVAPAMCCGLLKPQKPKDLSVKIEHVFDKFRKLYQCVLEVVVSWRYFVLILYILVILAGFFISNEMQSDLVPENKDGVVVGFGVAPEGRNLDYTIRYGNSLNKVFSEVKEGITYGVLYGFNIPAPTPNSVNGFITLKSLKVEDKVMKFVQDQFNKVTGALMLAFPMPNLPGDQALQPINFVLTTNNTYMHLYEASQTLLKEVSKYASIKPGGQSDLKITNPQVKIQLDRKKAHALNVTASQVNNALLIMLGQPVLNRFPYGGYSYELVPLAMRKFRDDPSDINHYYIKNKDNELFPLSSVVSVEEKVSPNTLNEFNQVHSTTFVASVAAGHTIGEALSDLKHIVKTKLPKDISINYSFQSREYIESEGALMHAFIVSILFIYFLLCLKYNNFVHPLSIMLSVPLCLVGAIYTLYIYGGTFNLYTKIGLIMLVGLISKHGILIVSFADEYLKENKGKFREAVVYAAGVRLRPILMTTGAMVLGALPLVMFSGAGAESRHQIGWVIIGGMCFGTCLSLFVVPCAFVMLNNKRFGAVISSVLSLAGLIVSVIYAVTDHTGHNHAAHLVAHWVLALLCLASFLFSLYLLLEQKRKFFWWIMLLLFVITIGVANVISGNLVIYLFAVAIFGALVDYFYRIRKIKKSA